MQPRLRKVSLTRWFLADLFRATLLHQKSHLQGDGEEQYGTRISDSVQTDVYIKKLMANVNIGLLEKGMKERSVGYLFRDLDECVQQLPSAARRHRVPKASNGGQVRRLRPKPAWRRRRH